MTDIRMQSPSDESVLAAVRANILKQMDDSSGAASETEGDAFTHGYLCGEKQGSVPLLEKISQLEALLSESRKQMESQKNEWLAWEAKRSDLEANSARYLWVTAYLIGEDVQYDDAIVACTSKAEIDALIDSLSSVPQHEGMTIAGTGAASLGALMREQFASRGVVYPDGNPNSALGRTK